MTDSPAKKVSNLPQPPLQVIYSGRVQGVGFRWTCERISRDHAVSGTVRNLSDGTVELFADGEPSAVSSFLSDIEKAMSANIQSTQIQALKEDVSFQGFQIVR